MNERLGHDNLAVQVMRKAGIDFTGDRVTQEGEIVTETATEAVSRLAGHIAITYPEGIHMLLDAGIEV
jgi:hypothetical protein